MTQKIRAINIANNSLKAFVFDASLSAAVDAAGTVSAVAAAANVAAQAVNTFVTLQTQSLGSVRPTINSITFYANSSYVASNINATDYLIVAGGGGGGGSPAPGIGFAGGGGGAGGLLSGSNILHKGRTYTVTIGAGGVGGLSVAPTNGTPSSIRSNQNDFIEITGSNFQPSSIVMVGSGNTALSTTVVSPTLLRAEISNTIVSGSYTVYVVNNTTGATGIRVNGITVASNTISFGGGAGNQQTPGVTASPGGSGGGTYWNVPGNSSGSGTPGQGYPGGLAPDGNGAAGGGGAGGAGGNYPAGHGGAAALWPFTGAYYAGGGGGGSFPPTSTAPFGGNQPPASPSLKGGGGDGGFSLAPLAANKVGRNATVNTGGGGGGGAMYPSNQSPQSPGGATGGNGGSGIVILAVPTPQYPGSAPGATVTTPPAAPGKTVLTYTSSGTFTP